MTSVAVLPLFARELNLLGQGVEVQQQEMRQPLHSRCQFFSGWLDAVKRFVSIKPQLVRPIFQGWCDAVFRCELVDSLFKFPCLDIGGKFAQRDFHAFAKHAGSGRPLLAMQTIARLNVILGNSGGSMRGSGGRMRRGFDPLNCDSLEITYLTWGFHYIGPQRIVYKSDSWASASWTNQHDVKQASLGNPCRRQPCGNETKTVATAARAVMDKDGHENL